MASRKKPKPQYTVPEEVESTPQSGWVYRTAEAAPASEPKPAPAPAKKTPVSSATSLASGVIETGVQTLAYSFAAMGHALLFTTKVMALPWSMTAKLIGR